MPFVMLYMWEGRDEKTKAELIKEVSHAVSKVLNISVEHTRMIINDVPKSCWGIGDKPASDMK